ncbi:MAG TPA: hypothetical protein VNR89_11905 [Roseomonas sp.]|nr:hypothetical protein [Roseomonas sp.]
MSFLKPIARRGAHVAATSVGSAEDWTELSGLFCSVDPRVLLRQDHGPQLLALQAALIAAATAGRSELPAEALAKVCGLRLRELGPALVRISRDTSLSAHGRDKRPVTAVLDRQVVRLGRVQRQVLEQDLYVAFPVSVLAEAPTPQHARAFLLSALASVRLTGTEKVEVTEARRWLRIPSSADLVAELGKLESWVCGKLFGGRRERPIQYRTERSRDGDPKKARLVVGAGAENRNRFGTVDKADRRFDLTSYRLPHLGYRLRYYAIADGQVHGHPMSVDAFASAAAQDWAAKAYGLDTTPSQWRHLWLALVSCWSAGEEATGVEWWPAGRFSELVEQGLTADEIFCQFVLDAAYESEPAEEVWGEGQPHGLLCSVSEADGAKLDAQRLARLRAVKAAAAALTAAEPTETASRRRGGVRHPLIVPVLPSDGAPRRGTRKTPFLPARKVVAQVADAAAAAGATDETAEIAREVARDMAKADRSLFARVARGQADTAPQDLIRDFASAVLRQRCARDLAFRVRVLGPDMPAGDRADKEYLRAVVIRRAQDDRAVREVADLVRSAWLAAFQTSNI